MASGKIMIVDDDRNICELLRLYIEKEGFETAIANDGKAAVQMFDSVNPDLMLLDIMLPGEDGLEILKKLRSSPLTEQLPVILATARGSEYDKVVGLDTGADDYLAKPFLPKELLLRVGAILNRAYPKQNEMVELAGATVDMANAEVWKNGEKQTLTAKEMQLFEKLYQNAGRIVTTGILCETICGEFWQGYESTLSTHIRHLREKIEENPSKPVSLVTVKGLGYRLNLKEVSP